MATFDVTTTRTRTFTQGWGVHVIPIWDTDDDGNDTGRISAIEVGVARIAADTVEIVGGVPCVLDSSGINVPVENFATLNDLSVGDTHDLRTRFFETESEAREHAEWTQNRWDNPSPWESFVEVG